jgi:5-methylcytosine-specific restriction enzyme A
MPDRPHTICRQPGCGKYVQGDYCPEHLKDNAVKQYDHARASDKTRKLYYTARYRRFRDFLQGRNPICQKINNGVRCNRPSSVLHHLVDPDAPGGLALFLTASNAVMLCPSCHPGGEAGTPNWKVNVDYVPTYAGYAMLGQTNPNPY